MSSHLESKDNYREDKYRCPLVSKRDQFQGPPTYTKSKDAQIPHMKWHSSLSSTTTDVECTDTESTVYQQISYLKTDWYPELTQKSYNSVIKRQLKQLKNGPKKKTFLQRKYTNVQQAHEKMLISSN